MKQVTKPDRRGVLKVVLGAGLLSRIEPATLAQKVADNCNCTRATDGIPLDVQDSLIRPVELRNINRVFGVPGSSLWRAKFEKFYADQTRLLEGMRFDALSQAGKVDYRLLRDRLQAEEKQVNREARGDDEIAPLVPFQQTIVGLEKARRRMESIEGQKSAADLIQHGVFRFRTGNAHSFSSEWRLSAFSIRRSSKTREMRSEALWERLRAHRAAIGSYSLLLKWCFDA